MKLSIDLTPEQFSQIQQRDPEEESVESWHRDTGEAQQRIGG